MGEKGGRGYQGNKIDLVIGKRTGSETSVYYHIIS